MVIQITMNFANLWRSVDEILILTILIKKSMIHLERRYLNLNKDDQIIINAQQALLEEEEQEHNKEIEVLETQKALKIIQNILPLIGRQLLIQIFNLEKPQSLAII